MCLPKKSDRPDRLVLLAGSDGPVRPPTSYNLGLGPSEQNWSWVFVGSALLQRGAWVVGMEGAVSAGWGGSTMQGSGLGGCYLGLSPGSLTR